MAGLGKILGTASEAISPISAVGNILDKLFTSDEEKLDKKIILQRLAAEPALAQIEINKIEAAHRSLFVAGWRPFIGWVCGSALAWQFIGYPIADWLTKLNNINITPPVLLTDALMELVIAMLGLGALRTYEKAIGKTK